MTRLIAGFLALFTFSEPAFATTQAKPAGFDHSHTTFSRVLGKFVVSQGAQSRVAYSRLKAEPSALVDYLAEVATVSGSDFGKYSSAQQLAFLINAYNAFTLKLIIDHYPVDSIRDIGGLFSSPWKKKFFRLLGEKRSLDEIEHEIIRKQYPEPRIHFVLVCAAISCPPLRAEAYTADRLDAQLDDQASRFLRDETRNRFDAKEKSLRLSSIFKWYGSDFEKNDMSIPAYVAKYMAADAREQAAIAAPGTRIKYMDYDWSLNAAK